MVRPHNSQPPPSLPQYEERQQAFTFIIGPGMTGVKNGLTGIPADTVTRYFEFELAVAL